MVPTALFQHQINLNYFEIRWTYLTMMRGQHLWSKAVPRPSCPHLNPSPLRLMLLRGPSLTLL